MVLDVNFIASIAERDIDLIVMEEFSISDEFREWFSTRVFGTPVYGEPIGAWHSISDSSLGETDILVVFSSDAGQRIALLVENKISAPPQPQQGERYRMRGEKGKNDGYWEEFRTCAIAPQRYLDSSQHTESYDCEIAYEELLAFYSSRRFRDPRYQYKARIIQEAIEQNRRGYQPEHSEAMTTFVKDYYEFFEPRYPELEMQEPKPRPAGSDWIGFNPSLPKGLSLYHQLSRGQVKLFFEGGAQKIEEIRSNFSEHMTNDMELGPAGKSAAIAINVPKINPLEASFNEKKGDIEVAIDGLQRLLKVVKP